jgi:YYY domain-containing protein
VLQLVIVLKWLLAFAVLTAVGAPLAAAVFPRFPRRGAPFALLAAVVPLALFVFWLGQVTFGLHTVIVGLGLVIVASAVAYRRGAVPEWRAVAGGYAVFVLGFLFLVAFRLYNAGVTPAGGEQFLHFGLVKALLRTDVLPPEDFWFAGEPLRYYYGTQMQVTSYTLLTDTAPRYGFNLGIAAFYGFLVVSAYGLAGAVTALRGRSYRFGGTLGVFFVAIAGALTTAVRLGFGILPRETAFQYGRPAFDAVRHMPYEEAVVRLSNPFEWGWFYTRYVVPNTLQEFPLYSFVKADLHGHALANGYILFAAALALGYYLTPAEERGRRFAILYGGMGLVAGVFGFMNTWSLPTVVGLAWLTLAAADAHPATLLPARLGDTLTVDTDPEAGERLQWLGTELWRILLAGVLAAGVGLVGVALSSPFLVFGNVPTNEGIGFLPPRTDIWPFLVIYGNVLALFAGYLLYSSRAAVREASPLAIVGVSLSGLLAVGVLLSVADFVVLAVTGPLLLGAWWLLRTDRIGFEGLLLVAGVGLILSMDLVYARVWPPTQIRWNTTLKVAVQGWTLAAAGMGSAAALVLSDARQFLASRASTEGVDAPTDGSEEPTSTIPEMPTPTRSALAVGVLVVAIVLLSSPFAVLTFTGEVGADAAAGQQATLDGLATHERWHAEEMEAIHWLDDRQGTPTIVEAPGRATYRWSSPASTLTGLPSVIGWDHQQGYRGVEAFERRAEKVDAVYAGPWSDAAATLRSYDVQYVYVGSNEREQYGENLRAFDERPELSVAFENEAVTIYEVDHAALSSSEGG